MYSTQSTTDAVGSGYGRHCFTQPWPIHKSKTSPNSRATAHERKQEKKYKTQKRKSRRISLFWCVILPQVEAEPPLRSLDARRDADGRRCELISLFESADGCRWLCLKVLGAEPPPFIEEISSVCVTLILSRVESRRQSSDSIRIRIESILCQRAVRH